MQCPNCNLNIKDDAAYCVHCGTRFQTSTTTPTIQKNNIVNNSAVKPGTPVNQAVPVNQSVQNNQTTGSSIEQYLKAYAGKSYNRILGCRFSVGTFFIGFPWLFFHKLFGPGLKMFITLVAGLGSLRLLKYLLSLFKVSTMLLLSEIYIDIYFILALVFYLVTCFKYAKDFQSFYLEDAEDKITRIVEGNTTNTEAQNIELCKKAGGISYVSIVLYIIGMIVLTIFIIFAVQNEKNKENYDKYIYHVKAVTRDINTMITNGELVKADGTEIDKQGVYYVLVDFDKLDKEHPLSNVRFIYDKKMKGYVLFDRSSYYSLNSYICLGHDQKYFISSFDDDPWTSSDLLKSEDMKLKGTCNIDYVKEQNAVQLIYNENKRTS